MTERKRYIRPEVQEVLLDVSQAVLAVCRSGATSVKTGTKTGYCRNTCKQNNVSTSSNNRATS